MARHADLPHAPGEGQSVHIEDLLQATVRPAASDGGRHFQGSHQKSTGGPNQAGVEPAPESRVHGRSAPAVTDALPQAPDQPSEPDRAQAPAAGAWTSGHDGGEPDPRRWKALAVCLVGGFMVLLDVSIVNVALKSISEGLHATGSEIQWVLSGYALTFGLLLVPAGRLGDVRGRRRMFIAGVALFTLASVACGFAQSGLWLVIARLAQGLAGGLLTPQISALIQQLFSGRERGKAFGLFGATIGISTALGPLIGGLLISTFGDAEGWRYVFFVNLPVGLVAIPFAFRLLPGASPDLRKTKHDYDPLGVVLLGAGIVVLLLPLVQEQQWKGSGKWLLLPVAALLLVLFVLWEFRYRSKGREALVDLGLFTRRSFSFGTSMITLYFAGFTPLFFVLTYLLQFGHSYSALLAGLATVPFAIGSGISAAIGGRVVDRFGRSLVLVGLIVVVVGYVGTVLATHLVTSNNVGWALQVPLLIGGIGSGLVISPNQTLTLSEVPVRQGGTAGGLIQVGQRIGSAIGIAGVGSVFYARVAATRGDYGSALQRGLFVAIGFLLIALLIAVVDVLVNRRREQTAAHESANRTHSDQSAAA